MMGSCVIISDDPVKLTMPLYMVIRFRFGTGFATMMFPSYGVSGYAGTPVRDLVFTVASRIRNDSVEVFPAMLEPRL